MPFAMAHIKLHGFHDFSFVAYNNATRFDKKNSAYSRIPNPSWDPVQSGSGWTTIKKKKNYS